MQEIRTSGSMSGDGKRSVAAWPKLPRPSSTLPFLLSAYAAAFGKGAGSPVSVILSPRALRVDNCRRLARARPIATPGALMPQC
jgi:hypothetical protein